MMNLRPLAGLTGILLLVAVLGSMATLGISNTDLANFITNSAEARAIDQKTFMEAEKSNIDIEAYRQIEIAKAQVERDRVLLEFEEQKKQAELDFEQAKVQYQIDLEQQRHRTNQRLMLEKITYYFILITSSLIVLTLWFGLIYRYKYRKSGQPVETSSIEGENIVVNDRWHNDLAWRQQKIELARNNERASRIRFNTEEDPTLQTFHRPSSADQKEIIWEDLPWVE
jgi:hypothetical protein